MRKQLSKKEVKELNARIEKEFGRKDFYSPKDTIVLDDGVYCKAGVPQFFIKDGIFIPALKLVLAGEFTLKKVVVDMGAVKFVCSGADIMRPGIKIYDGSITKGDIIVVVDNTHGKALAIGRSLWTAEEIGIMTQGKVIQNLHHVGDLLYSK